MRHVTIIGGGYAGVMAAKSAIEEGATATIVDRNGRHEFLPRLAAVAAGSSRQGDAWAPLEDLTDAHVIIGEAAAVDPSGSQVHLTDGRVLSTDAVVIATGNDPTWPAIDGLAHHGLPLRTAADALAIRSALSKDAERLVIVGANPMGVQLAGEVGHRHPHVPVVVVDQRMQILRGFSEPVRRHAASLLTQRAVKLRTQQSVERVTAEGVVLTDGSFEAGLVVCAGFSTQADAPLDIALVQNGQGRADASLRVQGPGSIYVACSPRSMSVQHAAQAGRAAGRNAARELLGMQPKPAQLDGANWVLAMGSGRGVGKLGAITFADPASDRFVGLLHNAMDRRHLLATGGLRAYRRYRPDRHRPSATAIANARRSTPREPASLTN